MSARRPAALALLALLGACDEARGPLDLDRLGEAPRDCVELIHEQLELERPIVAFVSDSPGSAGGWALVGGDSVSLVRVPATSDEPPTAELELHPAPSTAEQFSLRAGFDPGSVWVLRGEGVLTLRKVVPGEGVIANNGVLDNFAPQNDDLCGVTWTTRLILIEGRPFVLVVPSCSDDAALELHLLELDEHTLDFITTWSLLFDPCSYVDPSSCAAIFPYRIAQLETGQATQLASASRSSLAFTQTRELALFEGERGSQIISTSMSVLELRLDAGGPEARLLTFPDVWDDGVGYLDPVELAEDPFAQHAFVRNIANAGASTVFRLDTITDYYLQATGFDDALFGGRGQLVQLTYEAAMLELEDGRLRAISLRDDGQWPLASAVDVIEHADLVDFESAGPGMLLLRRTEHPDQLLHLACVE